MRSQHYNRSNTRLITVIAAIVIAVPGTFCSDDNFNSAMRMEAFPFEVVPALISAGVPVPGNGGIITNGAISTDRVLLFWTPAEDGETPAANLEYRVYRSDENNISTPELAAANGVPVSEWTANMTSLIATDLAPGTTYYFNVIVRDMDGHEAAYTTLGITTQSNVVYLFSAGRYTGNLTTPTTASARGDIDGLCLNAKNITYPSLPCLNVRAFISISNTDYIAAMSRNFGVPVDRSIISPAGVMIAGSWSDLLDGSISDTLENAGVANNFWWSGSDSYGMAVPTDSSVTGTTCGGWTVGTNASRGLEGASNRTDGQWMSEGSANCNNSLHLLCIGW